jgi:hypothetical protein
MTICAPKSGPSFSATVRAITSVPLPAVKGTTKVMDLSLGHSDCAKLGRAEPAVKAAAHCKLWRRVKDALFMVCLLVMLEI